MNRNSLIRLNKQNPLRLIIAGTAGQGAVFSATLIANAASEAGYNVAQTARSSAAVRSGPSVAHVTLSSRDIDFPFVETADVLIALSIPLPIAMPLMAPNGLILQAATDNASPLTNGTLVIPKADSLETGTNMILVGALVQLLDILSPKHFLSQIETLPKKTATSDRTAFEYGMQAANTWLEQIS